MSSSSSSCCCCSVGANRKIVRLVVANRAPGQPAQPPAWPSPSAGQIGRRFPSSRLSQLGLGASERLAQCTTNFKTTLDPDRRCSCVLLLFSLWVIGAHETSATLRWCARRHQASKQQAKNNNKLRARLKIQLASASSCCLFSAPCKCLDIGLQPKPWPLRSSVPLAKSGALPWPRGASRRPMRRASKGQKTGPCHFSRSLDLTVLKLELPFACLCLLSGGGKCLLTLSSVCLS